jgi:hypothetical protein
MPRHLMRAEFSWADDGDDAGSPFEVEQPGPAAWARQARIERLKRGPVPFEVHADGQVVIYSGPQVTRLTWTDLPDPIPQPQENQT